MVGIQVVHYCCGSYDVGDYGGVATYDHALKTIFEDRKFFRGPQEKMSMLRYLESFRDENVLPIVFTDNHLACDIPNTYFCFIVHHGCARRTAHCNPTWDPYWKNLCVSGQDQMLQHRDPKNTHIISISESTKRDFTIIYKQAYTRFNNTTILHCSQFDENLAKMYEDNTDTSRKAKIIGNFGGKKGNIGPLRNSYLSNHYDFEQLNIRGNDYKDFDSFISAKQQYYLDSDLFLQISNSEGNSYATLDAALCGMAIIATKVGLFFEVPTDCFVAVDLDQIYNVTYMEERIKYALENRIILGKKMRTWILNNCSRAIFQRKTKELVRKISDEMIH